TAVRTIPTDPLLHVVHEVHADRASSPGVERRKDSRLSVGRRFRDGAQSRIAQEAHREIAAFADALVLRDDRRLPDPGLVTCSRATRCGWPPAISGSATGPSFVEYLYELAVVAERAMKTLIHSPL